MATIKPIDASGFAAVEAPANLGAAPSLQWLPIDRLGVDPSYQRSISKVGAAQVRRIAERFDWTLFAPVIVSPVEGGRFAIVDGQHRTTAAKLVGAESVPCSVIFADQVQQAKAFAAVNGEITRLTITQMWKARCAAGDAIAIAAQDICRRADIVVVHSTKAAYLLEPNEITSIATIEQLARMKPHAMIELALRCLVAGARGQGGALARPALLGCFNVLEGLEGRPGKELVIAWFASIDVKQLLVDAQRQAKMRNGNVVSFFEAALIEELERVRLVPKARMAVAS